MGPYFHGLSLLWALASIDSHYCGPLLLWTHSVPLSFLDRHNCRPVNTTLSEQHWCSKTIILINIVLYKHYTYEYIQNYVRWILQCHKKQSKSRFIYINISIIVIYYIINMIKLLTDIIAYNHRLPKTSDRHWTFFLWKLFIASICFWNLFCKLTLCEHFVRDFVCADVVQDWISKSPYLYNILTSYIKGSLVQNFMFLQFLFRRCVDMSVSQFPF